MADSTIIVALLAAVASAISICLQKFRFVYDHHPDGVYELVIAFEREQTEQNTQDEPQHPHTI